MNKRQKKKMFKKITKHNPQEWLHYTAPVFHSVTGWARKTKK